MSKYFDGEKLSGYEESPETTTTNLMSRTKLSCVCCGREVGLGEMVSTDGVLWRCKECSIKHNEEYCNKDAKITDLEAKLAEYEKELMDNEKCFTEKDVEGLIKDREETINFLKQQLAESEEEIEGRKNLCYLRYLQLDRQDKEIKELKHQLEESKTTIIDLTNTCDKWADKYINLQKQLVEKDKEIEFWEKDSERIANDYQDLANECNKEIERLEKQLAEKEKEAEDDEITRHMMCGDYTWCEMVTKLMKEVEEKDNTITNLIEDSKASKELLKKEIENLRIDLKDYEDLEENISTKYDKVVEQLAEKDKEIERLKSESRK